MDIEIFIYFSVNIVTFVSIIFNNNYRILINVMFVNVINIFIII
jgi:hypothetical protein